MKIGNLFNDLRSTTKPSEKQLVLEGYDTPFLRGLIHATYEPFLVYHVKIQRKQIPEPGDQDMLELVDETNALIEFCAQSNSNKQNREKAVELLGQLNRGSQELLVGVLHKNWKVGLGVRNILKIFPGIVSQFEVQLANTYKPGTKAHDAIGRWILSYKLDGLRCVALRESSDEYYDKGRWTLYSRKGKEYLTAEHLKPQLETLYQRYGWSFFDGELYKHGLTFEEVQGLVTGFTRGQAPQLEYHVFVAGDAKHFLAGTEPNHVDPVSGDPDDDAPDIYFVNKGFVSSEDIYHKLEEAFDLGYEGIMLRDPENLYDYKRSNALLKLKQSEIKATEGEIISDAEVLSIDYGDFPVITDGAMIYEKLLLRIWVEQEDGTECKVGSGFDLKFRRYYTANPWELIGKTVEIKHQMWGAKGRMRFPRLWRVREDL